MSHKLIGKNYRSFGIGEFVILIALFVTLYAVSTTRHPAYLIIPGIALIALIGLVIYPKFTLSIVLVGSTALILTTQHYIYAFIPSFAILVLLVFGTAPKYAFFAIVLLIPFGGFRDIGGLKITWLLGLWLLLAMAYRLVIDIHSLNRFKSDLIMPMVLFFMVSLFSAFFSPYPETSYHDLALLLIAYVFVFSGMFFLEDENHYLHTIPKLIVVSVSICLALGVYGYITNTEMFLTDIDYMKRAAGGTEDPNNTALMGIFCLPFLMHFIHNAKEFRVKGLLVLVLLINIFGVILTYSRGGALVLAGTMLAILVQNAKYIKPKYIGLAVAIVGVLTVLVVVLTPESYWKRQMTVTSSHKDKSLQRRSAYIDIGLDSFKRDPVIGSGPGTFRDRYSETRTAMAFHSEWDTTKRYAHNTYIEVLVGTGAIGIVIFLGLIWKTIKNFSSAKQIFRDNDMPDMVDITLAYETAFFALLAYIFMFSDVYHKFLLMSIIMSHFAYKLTLPYTNGNGSNKNSDNIRNDRL